MKYSVISFDLQGTLSDAAYSDEFWLKLLPAFYAKSRHCTPDEGKSAMKDIFAKMGKYDLRYYSVAYWRKTLRIPQAFGALNDTLQHRPLFYADTLNLLRELRAAGHTLIATTSTSYDFIDKEMHTHKGSFDRIYSSIDDFGIAGKPPELYARIARWMRREPKYMLHIGDDPEMDVKNPLAAGWNAYEFSRTAPREKSIADIRKFLL